MGDLMKLMLAIGKLADKINADENINDDYKQGALYTLGVISKQISGSLDQIAKQRKEQQ